MGVCCLLGLFSLASAQAVQWDWIQSDDKYGKFINPSSLVIISDKKGRLEYLDVTVRNAYSLAGAQEEIASYGKNINKTINPVLLSYSLQKLRLYPAEGLIDSEAVEFYDKTGTKLGQSGRISNLNVAYRDFYAPYFYYTLDKFTTNREYEAWKSKNHYLTLRSLKDVDGSEHLVELDTLTVRARDDTVSGYVWYTTKKPGRDPQYLLVQNRYNLKNSNWTRVEIYRNNSPQDRGEVYPKVSRALTAAPGSLAAKERNEVLKYYHNHQDWVHRYERGAYADTRLAK